MTSDTGSQPAFQSRVDAVFGALQTATNPDGTAWSLRDEQVSRTGKDTDYSSEEEEEAKRADAENGNLLDLQVSLEGDVNEDGELELPSNAFCRALDREEEFDANDALASGVVEHRRERRPPRHTEVLDDNIFERLSKAREAGPVPADGMTLNPARPGKQGCDPDLVEVNGRSAAANASGQAVAAVSTIEDDSQGRPKRVRFAEPYVPHQHREDPSAGNPPSLRHGKPPMGPPQPGRARGRSYVPHHVRFPNQYTAYVLDEPITVGSGDWSSADNGSSELLKAARAAQTAVHATSAAEPEPATIELPSFGAGVAFKPQNKKAKGGTESQAADRVNQTGLGAHLTAVADMDAVIEEGEGTEAMADMMEADETADGAAAEFKGRERRHRNLRGRSSRQSD